MNVTWRLCKETERYIIGKFSLTFSFSLTKTFCWHLMFCLFFCHFVFLTSTKLSMIKSWFSSPKINNNYLLFHMTCTSYFHIGWNTYCRARDQTNIIIIIIIIVELQKLNISNVLLVNSFDLQILANEVLVFIFIFPFFLLFDLKFL